MATIHVILFVCLSRLGTTSNEIHQRIAGNACNYTGNSIDCGHRHLTEVPDFHTSMRYTTLTINLEYNSISVLGADIFRNITGTSIGLQLNSNTISVIDRMAFRGIERNVAWLNLDFNRLLELPHALPQLTALTALSVHGNPVRNFDVDSMQAVGSTLRTFRFGSAETESWQPYLLYLHRLTELGIYDVPSTSIPTNPFHGFEQTLETLYLVRSGLARVPPSLCSLLNLRNLNLYSNLLGINGTFSIPCHVPLTRVSLVTLSYNRLNHFPDLYNVFPNMQNLHLTGNPLLNIKDESNMSRLTQLTHLYLDYCSLTTTPSSLSSLPRLEYLQLGGNKIKTIGSNNFIGFPSLQTVIYDNNPLLYISEYAFANSSITSVELRNTSLRTIPSAVKLVEHRIDLHLESNNIECDCDLVWVELWNYLNISRIYGNCVGSGASLQTFVNAIPSHCPRLPVG